MERQRRDLPRLLLVALLCAASLQVLATTAQAKSLTVCPSGCSFTTIAAALQVAADGDTIDIGEGTYAGGVVLEKNVTLKGAGRDRTTIQGTNQAAVVRIATRANVAIQAVTITGGGGSQTRVDATGGGGILNEGGLTLTDSIVRENTVPTGVGGGLYSNSSKILKIVDSVFSGNRATDGGGLFLRGGDVVIEDTTVSSNRSTRNGGGILHQGSETLRLEQCVIRDNQADFFVGGVSSSSELEVVDSTVSGNSAPNGGGLQGGRERLKVVRSTISGNTTRGNGGGIRVGSGGVELVDSTVEKNRAGANGAGLFTTNDSGAVSLRNSTIAGNIASQDGGGIKNDSSQIDLDNSKIIDNQAGRQGGGIFSTLVKKGLVKVLNGSVIAGNQPDQCFPVALKCQAR